MAAVGWPILHRSLATVPRCAGSHPLRLIGPAENPQRSGSVRNAAGKSTTQGAACPAVDLSAEALMSSQPQLSGTIHRNGHSLRFVMAVFCVCTGALGLCAWPEHVVGVLPLLVACLRTKEHGRNSAINARDLPIPHHKAMTCSFVWQLSGRLDECEQQNRGISTMRRS